MITAKQPCIIGRRGLIIRVKSGHDTLPSDMARWAALEGIAVSGTIVDGQDGGGIAKAEREPPTPANTSHHDV